MTRIFVSLALFVTVVAAPAAAQGPRLLDDDPDALSARGVFFVEGQRFHASSTFDAAFGNSVGQLFGGGVLIAKRGVFVEATLSRFKKTGQRAYIFDGQAFGLNIPLTATITPFEVTGGFRFRRETPVIPYAGVGIGSYGYKETSPLGDTSEDTSTRHVGYLIVGGAEFRVHRWIGLGADVQYTHIPGILGSAGLSKDAGEDDLGGIGFHAKVIIGIGR
jgi:opacity protein-like surface antigen